MSSARSLSKPRCIDVPQQGRRLAHEDRACAERLDHQSKLRQFLRPRDQRLRLRRIEFHDFRNEQRLPAHAAIGEHLLHALIHQPLVRGVLIDDDDAVFGLRDDIGLVNLRPRRAERKELGVLRILDGLRPAHILEIGQRDARWKPTIQALPPARSAS